MSPSMMVARSFSVLLMLLLVGAGSVHADDIKDTVKRSYKVQPDGTLSLDLDRGNVEIEAISGNEVRIEVERIVDTNDREKAKALLGRHELRFDQRGNDVVLESRLHEDDGRWGFFRDRSPMKVRILVQIPRQYHVHFNSGTGNVTIGDIGGRVNGRTGAGNIVVGAVDGDVNLTSGSGNISLDRVVGRVEATTGAGNIDVQDVQGEVRINTGAGNITAQITRQPSEDSRLSSGAGNVTVYLNPRISVDVDAVAGVGSARTDFPLTIEGKWMKKSFEGALNGGGPQLRLHAGVGNVTLRRL